MAKSERDRLLYPIESQRAERSVLRACMQYPEMFPELLSLYPAATPTLGALLKQLLSFWNDNGSLPAPETFAAWCTDADMVDRFDKISQLELVDKSQVPILLKILRGTAVARGLLDMADSIADNVGRVPSDQLLKTVFDGVTTLSGLSSGQAGVQRNWYWDDAPRRWERFKELAKNPDKGTGVLFGIDELDKVTGGLHSFKTESDLVAIYGKPGTYKSRLMLNMAFNQARQGHKVLYISREMAFERLVLLLDALESTLPDEAGVVTPLAYKLLEDAYLVGRYKKRYANLLETVYLRRKYPLFLVDCPATITTLDIIRELELFRAAAGCYPRVMYLDYANLIKPVAEYQHGSELLDNLFMELLNICKGFGVPIVTAIRESRTGSLIKERSEVGLEHVGLSQAIAFHVHQLWHIDHTKEDKALRQVWLRSKKNRYGEEFEIALTVMPEHAYVGSATRDANTSYSFE